MWASKVCMVTTKNCSYIKFCNRLALPKQLHTSNALTAGHSKWANIRHIKALKDGQKSALFTRYARQIRIAIQDGGSTDPALNSILRNVIDDALRKNMPMATIQNSIKKSNQSQSLLKKHVLYWRFQQKVFAICVLFTDNFAQLKMELAPVLRKSGAAYVDAQHIFDDIGIIEATVSDEVKKQAKTSAELEEVCTDDAIECGVEEVELIDPTNGTFMCNPIELGAISRSLKSKGYVIESSEHVYIPKSTVTLSQDELRTYEAFLSKVRDLPGIEDIYDNLETSSDQSDGPDLK